MDLAFRRDYTELSENVHIQRLTLGIFIVIEPLNKFLLPKVRVFEIILTQKELYCEDWGQFLARFGIFKLSEIQLFLIISKILHFLPILKINGQKRLLLVTCVPHSKHFQHQGGKVHFWKYLFTFVTHYLILYFYSVIHLLKMSLKELKFIFLIAYSWFIPSWEIYLLTQLWEIRKTYTWVDLAKEIATHWQFNCLYKGISIIAYNLYELHL